MFPQWFYDSGCQSGKWTSSLEARMSGGAVTLRVANLSDLPFIMATERMLEFDRMVGRWAEDEHRAALARTNHAYLLGINAAGRPGAFSIIRDIDDAHGNACLKRFAVKNPGRGFGSQFLGLVVNWVFAETRTHRLWLDVLSDNARARHVYFSQGFMEEGVLRSAYKLPDESRIDLILMSLTRPEWLGRCVGNTD